MYDKVRTLPALTRHGMKRLHWEYTQHKPRHFGSREGEGLGGRLCAPCLPAAPPHIVSNPILSFSLWFPSS